MSRVPLLSLLLLTALAVAFSLDGKLLASGSEDGTVLVWEVPAQP